MMRDGWKVREIEILMDRRGVWRRRRRDSPMHLLGESRPLLRIRCDLDQGRLVTYYF